MLQSLDDADIEFQNSIVKVVALGNLQELNVAENIIGPLQEGREYEMRYWIALELVQARYARFYEEDSMTFSSLNRVHWLETKLQSGRQLSPLPEFFYSKLRRYLRELREKVTRDASFSGEYAQASRLAQDIVNCRLNKIVNLATYSQVENILKSLSVEERRVFDSISSIILKWSSKILDLEGLK